MNRVVTWLQSLLNLASCSRPSRFIILELWAEEYLKSSCLLRIHSQHQENQLFLTESLGFCFSHISRISEAWVILSSCQPNLQACLIDQYSFILTLCTREVPILFPSYNECLIDGFTMDTNNKMSCVLFAETVLAPKWKSDHTCSMYCLYCMYDEFIRKCR